jgi:hypothetical protein
MVTIKAIARSRMMLRMTKTRAERDRANLERRLEVLQLPVVPLRRQGYVKPTDRAEWGSEPAVVGIGPDGTAYAVWAHRHDLRRKQVTSHRHGTEVDGAVEIATDLRVSFVQPLPQGRILLAAARTWAGSAPNGEVWSDDGELVCTGSLGDALEELLTTLSGKVWVGYFDEAMGGHGPQAHGLVRYAQDLSPDWLYPVHTGLPTVFDCYTLNVAGEDAYCCPYTDFHLIAVVGDQATDHGIAPHRSAHGLLMRGAKGALIGGSGPEYDLVTPLRVDRDGVKAVGSRCRIVLPDGTEAQRLRYTCRGPDLHAFVSGTWYRTSLDDLMDASADHRR